MPPKRKQALPTKAEIKYKAQRRAVEQEWGFPTIESKERLSVIDDVVLDELFGGTTGQDCRKFGRKTKEQAIWDHMQKGGELVKMHFRYEVERIIDKRIDADRWHDDEPRYHVQYIWEADNEAAKREWIRREDFNGGPLLEEFNKREALVEVLGQIVRMSLQAHSEKARPNYGDVAKAHKESIQLFRTLLTEDESSIGPSTKVALEQAVAELESIPLPEYLPSLEGTEEWQALKRNTTKRKKRLAEQKAHRHAEDTRVLKVMGGVLGRVRDRAPEDTSVRAFAERVAGPAGSPNLNADGTAPCSSHMAYGQDATMERSGMPLIEKVLLFDESTQRWQHDGSTDYVIVIDEEDPIPSTERVAESSPTVEESMATAPPLPSTQHDEEGGGKNGGEEDGMMTDEDGAQALNAQLEPVDPIPRVHPADESALPPAVASPQSPPATSPPGSPPTETQQSHVEAVDVTDEERVKETAPSTAPPETTTESSAEADVVSLALDAIIGTIEGLPPMPMDAGASLPAFAASAPTSTAAEKESDEHTMPPPQPLPASTTTSSIPPLSLPPTAIPLPPPPTAIRTAAETEAVDGADEDGTEALNAPLEPVDPVPRAHPADELAPPPAVDSTPSTQHDGESGGRTSPAMEDGQPAWGSNAFNGARTPTPFTASKAVAIMKKQGWSVGNSLGIRPAVATPVLFEPQFGNECTFRVKMSAPSTAQPSERVEGLQILNLSRPPVDKNIGHNLHCIDPASVYDDVQVNCGDGEPALSEKERYKALVADKLAALEVNDDREFARLAGTADDKRFWNDLTGRAIKEHEKALQELNIAVFNGTQTRADVADEVTRLEALIEANRQRRANPPWVRNYVAPQRDSDDDDYGGGCGVSMMQDGTFVHVSDRAPSPERVSRRVWLEGLLLARCRKLPNAANLTSEELFGRRYKEWEMALDDEVRKCSAWLMKDGKDDHEFKPTRLRLSPTGTVYVVEPAVKGTSGTRKKGVYKRGRAYQPEREWRLDAVSTRTFEPVDPTYIVPSAPDARPTQPADAVQSTSAVPQPTPQPTFTPPVASPPADNRHTRISLNDYVSLCIDKGRGKPRNLEEHFSSRRDAVKDALINREVWSAVRGGTRYTVRRVLGRANQTKVFKNGETFAETYQAEGRPLRFPRGPILEVVGDFSRTSDIPAELLFTNAPRTQ